MVCPTCLGSGELIPREEHFGVIRCGKCKGHGIIDWVENVVGKKQHFVKPGVYAREVDHSYYIPDKSDINFIVKDEVKGEWYERILCY